MSACRDIEPFCFNRFHYEGLSRHLAMTDLEVFHFDTLDPNALGALEMCRSLDSFSAAMNFYREAREYGYTARVIVVQDPVFLNLNCVCEVLPTKTRGFWYLDHRQRGAYYNHEAESSLACLPWNFEFTARPNYEADLLQHVYA